nr:chitinase 2-like [Tanacetum cinerariifolium]
MFGLIYEETRGVLKIFLENVIRDAVTYTEHARHKTVTAMDFVYDLKGQGRTLYGFGDHSRLQEYNLDGIDIDYEHFHADPDTFAECIEKLITTLKGNEVISFASIAPFDDGDVQRITVVQFMTYFETQRSNYGGGSILASFISDAGGAANSNLLHEYIGAESDSVKLTYMPINSKVEVHYILAFAIDYTSDNHPSPTNGRFNVFWETNHLGPSQIASVKDKHSNVKVAVSLGGNSVVSDNNKVYFSPKSINSWVKNAVSSLTSMIKQYNLDGVDIDYENFHSHDEDTFAECIGQLLTTLKKTRTIKFASIAPYEDDELVNSHYLALWKKYGHVIDYVNFQFYAYDKLSVSKFVNHFDHLHSSSYAGGQLLASFISKGITGLPPNDGFFEACKERVKIDINRRIALMHLKLYKFDHISAIYHSSSMLLDKKWDFVNFPLLFSPLQSLLAMASQQAIAPRSDSDSKIFAECIGKLITTLKNKEVISFASIVPYDDDEFYAYDKGTTVSQFINYFRTQSSNYEGGNILTSFSTEGSGGLSPKDGFFKACNRL